MTDKHIIDRSKRATIFALGFGVSWPVFKAFRHCIAWAKPVSAPRVAADFMNIIADAMRHDKFEGAKILYYLPPAANKTLGVMVQDKQNVCQPYRVDLATLRLIRDDNSI